ncbi:PAS domain-containing sensor histidine kinase [Pectinatus haikarae]|uniref:histidine kinase n=1 Tax=Pectinatus haikarae TaxID=349096 RepID=A0ABT9Y4M4_9FIRM|nr:PAS domain-containing sensor histidine kinase [Pectinatus haikarae]MDQ0202588.1 two-component sensor histidine kinase [Pectinatus haikarae]
MNSRLRGLCLQFTGLTDKDIEQLEQVEGQLPLWAALVDTDLFIDAPLSSGNDSIVLAWACENKKKSLYRKSVVGEIATAGHEPAVYQALFADARVVDTRGVSQEGVPISQTVTPIKNRAGKNIGVLIMEKDISRELRQQKQVLFLTQTADHLSQTLMSLTTTGCGWDEWLGSGIFVLDPLGQITYANKQAMTLGENLWQKKEVMGENLREFLKYASLQDMVTALKTPQNFQYAAASFLLRAHPLVAHSDLSGCVVSIQDITELRRKEKQLDMQSIMIAEINHRVKNTLQNVISLLHMQIRRTKEKGVREEFLSCINRILAIAKVYEVFTYQSRDLVNLRELAAYIMEKIIESSTLPQNTMRGTVDGPEVFIHARQAVPVALVLNELISNAVKHGFCGQEKAAQINICLGKNGDLAHIKVRNSGKLLTAVPAVPAGRRESLGLYLVRLFVCEQLKGSFSLYNKDECVVADISFPLWGLSSAEGENTDEIVVHFGG